MTAASLGPASPWGEALGLIGAALMSGARASGSAGLDAVMSGLSRSTVSSVFARCTRGGSRGHSRV
jgi:hypothetical protein